MSNIQTSSGRAGARVSTSPNFENYTEHWGELGEMTVPIADLHPSTTYYAKGMYDAGTAIAVQADYLAFSTDPDYMYLENRGNSQVTVTVAPSYGGTMVHQLDLQYSYDRASWTDMPFSNSSATVAVPAGGKVYFRGDNEYWYSNDDEDGYRFSASGPVYGGGNIMTLLDRSGILDAVPENGLNSVFSQMSNLITPPDCSSIMEIGKSGLYGAFGWSGITTPPDFSNLGIVLEYGLGRVCMQCDNLTASSDLSSVNEWWEAAATYAFALCDRLTYVPPFGDAAFLSENMQAHSGNGMFENMYQGCTSLREMPDLTAISISSIQDGWSYLLFCSMFEGCTSLLAADKLPAISSPLEGTITDGMFLNMFKDCTSLVYADLAGIEYADMDEVCKGMFYGCTRLSEISVNGDSLGIDAYENMFYGCSALKVVTVENGSFFDANDDGSYSHTNWLYGVSKSGIMYVPQEMASGVPTDSSSGCQAGWELESY